MLLAMTTLGQKRHYSAFTELQAIGTTNGQVPFWMRSNQYGSIPLNGVSASLLAGIERNYDSIKGRGFDWGFGLEARENIGYKTELIVPAAYLKMRVAFLEFRAGRSKEVYGLVDTVLSSGSFSIAGNALGIPKLQIAVTDFEQLQLFDHTLALKGNFAHGFVGDRYLKFDDPQKAKYYLHQKSIYARLKRPEWSVGLYVGFNHQAIWTADKRYRPEPNDLKTVYREMFRGHNYGPTKIGNQLGSFDIGLSVDWPKSRLMFYRQQFYDINGVFDGRYLLDGLTGLTIENRREDENEIHWRKLLFECLYTANQGGEYWNRISNTGDQNYYNNADQSWYYQGWGVGTPFISPAHVTNPELPNLSPNYFSNNRVLAFHMGATLRVGAWENTAKFSFSHNRGTFMTSVEGSSMRGQYNPPAPDNIFPRTNQFSAYWSAMCCSGNKFNVGYMLAFDHGGLYENSVGVGLIVRRQYKF